MSRLYLGRLPSSVRESDIERFFKGFGKIREIILKDGFGFVVRNCLVLTRSIADAVNLKCPSLVVF